MRARWCSVSLRPSNVKWDGQPCCRRSKARRRQSSVVLIYCLLIYYWFTHNRVKFLRYNRSVGLCVCECTRVRESAWGRVCVRESVRESVCAWESVCVRDCVCVRLTFQFSDDVSWRQCLLNCVLTHTKRQTKVCLRLFVQGHTPHTRTDTQCVLRVPAYHLTKKKKNSYLQMQLQK